jgi:putative transcriptional regulator
MTLHDTTYAAFMLDYAAGALPPAERLAAELHRALSPEGARNARMFDALGGAMLERARPEVAQNLAEDRLGLPDSSRPTVSRLDPYLKRDLVALKWRKDIWGMKTLPTDTPMASLLRLDPGEEAPSHGHGRRDITVVLCGTYGDEEGIYQRGDIVFAAPGLTHKPRAVGNETCVCLLATERGRPIRGFLGMFNIGVPKLHEPKPHEDE